MPNIDNRPRLRSVATLVFALFSTTLMSVARAQDAQPIEDPLPADAQGDMLATVVVTAPAVTGPLEVKLNPKAAQQPLPANDGASFLKTVPGMNVIRKGGTDGDPVFRGMAGSRLNILIDGEQILGGCGGRMDPPTAYIFPDAYDRVTVLKGPQSVVHGPASAGVVLFERRHEPFDEVALRLNSALTIAGFDRFDGFIDIKGGNNRVYAEGIVTHAKSGDYKDGNGDTVHSRYKRDSATAIVGVTPDENTRIELSAIRSDAEAAYADRGMDGSKFARENIGFKFEKRKISEVLDKLEASVYYNYVDHVMDSYSLRTPPANPMASNPDRKTTGGRFALSLLPSTATSLTIGADQQSNTHRGRSGGPSWSTEYYRYKPRVTDARFRNVGVFSELTWYADDADRVVSGLRLDLWRAKDERPGSATANNNRSETLRSGFIRYERDYKGGTAYVGLGHSERAPDFWEAINKESTSGTSAFNAIEPEKTTQLDLGASYRFGSWQGFASLFYSKVNDFILIHSRYAKPAGTATVARNIDATTWGGEAGVNYSFAHGLKAGASVAYVHGHNDSDHHALGQIPPLEGRFTLDWAHGPWSAGALWRVVAAQNHYAVNEGNIVGQDVGKSGGFGVFSLNAGYRVNKNAQISFGVDNLFNKTYAEFISKSGADVAGYEQTTRVNEPGRTAWARAQIGF